MNLCFSALNHARITTHYEEARQQNVFPGAFAMANVDEFWAEMSQSFFDVNNEIGGPKVIEEKLPAVYDFLKTVYGEGG